MKNLILIFLIATTFTSFGQEYKTWNDYEVIRFYQKIELEYRSLDKDGEEIEYVGKQYQFICARHYL